MKNYIVNGISNMTRKHRPSSSESTLYSKQRRRRTPTHKKKIVEVEDEEEDDDEDDYNDASDSQYNDESQVEESEQFENEPEKIEEEEYDVDDTGSKSISNEESNSYIPENKTPSSFSNNPSQPIMNASSSYVKIAPLPIFRGTPSESPITHLSRFNKVCRANNASSIEMQMRIFPVTLEGEAALWYDLNIEPYHPPLPWEDIKLSFLQAYYKFEPCEELRSELMGIHQGEKESVRSYFLRLQWILKRWPEHGLNENVVKGVFVDGLRQEFHDWILMQKPDSLNDALKLAFVFEQMRSIRGTTKGSVGVGGGGGSCGFCEGLHEESGCELRVMMREMWRESKKEKEEGKDINLLRSFSMGESSSGGQGKIETDDEGLVGSMMKKNRCQCTKHQCGNKKLLRNSSLQSRISSNY